MSQGKIEKVKHSIDEICESCGKAIPKGTWLFRRGYDCFCTLDHASAGKFHIEKIDGSNRRPGMKHHEGYLVRYRPHETFGWLGCRTFATLEEAESFAASLNSSGEICGL